VPSATLPPALTAHPTRGVHRTLPAFPENVREQITLLVADMRPHAVKLGMLATDDVLRAVEGGLEGLGPREDTPAPPWVIDPVLASSSGEPLLEPDRLFEILAYGRQVGLQSLNVNTNGMLLTPEIADRLLVSGADLMVVGIDGFTKASYERARTGGDRDVVYRNVEVLLERRRALGSGPEVQVQFIEMDFNRGELDDYRDYWLARGAVVKVRRQLSWGGKFDTSLCVPDEDRIPCPWAITMMHVFWDGRVPRCPGDMEYEEGVGNAWEHSIAHLWGELGRYRDLHLEHRFDELPERCHGCQDWMTGAAERLRPDARPTGTA